MNFSDLHGGGYQPKVISLKCKLVIIESLCSLLLTVGCVSGVFPYFGTGSQLSFPDYVTLFFIDHLYAFNKNIKSVLVAQWALLEV